MIACATGTSLTGNFYLNACSSMLTVNIGVVVGCLRKLKRWSLISIYEEYRRFSGTKMQQQYEQFIELFDIDLVVESKDLVRSPMAV